jgi:hypothetical protein
MFINDFIDCELNHLFYVKFLDYPLVFRKGLLSRVFGVVSRIFCVLENILMEGLGVRV